ncbi:MAG: hypothetical protein ACOH1Y_15565 [Propionicimonas sp.]
MNIKRIAGTAAAAAIAFSSLALMAPDASAKGLRVEVSGNCTATSDGKLKAKNDGGRLEVEFEVDANRNLQVWAVTLADNGTTVWSGNATTQAPSGSFSVNKRIANRAGADTITARARNAKTGETCTAGLVFRG